MFIMLRNGKQGWNPSVTLCIFGALKGVIKIFGDETKATSQDETG